MCWLEAHCIRLCAGNLYGFASSFVPKNSIASGSIGFDLLLSSSRKPELLFRIFEVLPGWPDTIVSIKKVLARLKNLFFSYRKSLEAVPPDSMHLYPCRQRDCSNTNWMKTVPESGLRGEKSCLPAGFSELQRSLTCLAHTAKRFKCRVPGVNFCGLECIVRHSVATMNLKLPAVTCAWKILRILLLRRKCHFSHLQALSFIFSTRQWWSSNWQWRFDWKVL